MDTLFPTPKLPDGISYTYETRVHDRCYVVTLYKEDATWYRFRLPHLDVVFGQKVVQAEFDKHIEKFLEQDQTCQDDAENEPSQ